MAYGDHTSTLLDSLEFETVKATNIAVRNLSDGYVAVFYTSQDTDGVVKTYSVAADGTLAAVDSWTWKAGIEATYATLVAGSVFVAAGRVGSTPTAYTFDAGDSGSITKSLLDSQALEGATSNGVARIIKKTGTNVFVFLLANSTLVTATIQSDGTSITVVDTWTPSIGSSAAGLCYVGSDTFLIAGQDGVLRTFSVNDSGTITKSWIDTETIDASSQAVNNHLAHAISNTYWVAYRDAASRAKVATFTVGTAGGISAVRDMVSLGVTASGYPRIYALTPGGSNGYAIVDWGNTGNDAFLKNLSTDPEGTITAGTAYEYISNVSGLAHAMDGFVTGRAASSGSMVKGIEDSPGNDGFLYVVEINNRFPTYPSRALARITGLRHIYRPGSYRAEATIDSVLSSGQDVPETEVTIPAPGSNDLNFWFFKYYWEPLFGSQAAKPVSPAQEEIRKTITVPTVSAPEVEKVLRLEVTRPPDLTAVTMPAAKAMEAPVIPRVAEVPRMVIPTVTDIKENKVAKGFDTATSWGVIDSAGNTIAGMVDLFRRLFGGKR